MHASVPDVSIILVNWNTRDLILACLESLPAALGSLSADVWVVDNASTDGSAEAVRTHYPQVHLIANAENVGFAAANNQAIAASSGRYILLLNSDTLAPPGSVEHLVCFADERPRSGIVGPMLLDQDTSFQASFADFPSLTREWLSVTGLGRRIYYRNYPSYGPRQSQACRRVDYVTGACMLARRAAVEQVGPLDENYFMYSEEVDWCKRMWQAGWEVWYTPAVQIVHYGGQSTRQQRAAMVRLLYRSKVRFFRKHYGPVSATILQASFFTVLRCKWLRDYLKKRSRPLLSSSGGIVGWVHVRGRAIETLRGWVCSVT